MECEERKIIKYLDKTLIVVYNKKTKNYSDENSDFFSEKEISFIKEMAKKSVIDIEFIEGEFNFINNIHNYFANEIVVLNLTRRGSRRNQKCAVTALCDLKRISVIGSSVLTMALCRSKDYLEPLMKIRDVKYPQIIHDISEIDDNSLYIIKAVNSAGSIGLTIDSVKYGISISASDFDKGQIIQQYIEGYELEVPFIIKNKTVEILGVYALSIDGQEYLSIDNQCILDFYKADFFEYTLREVSLDKTEYNKLHAIVTDICDLLEIENYGRIDFRTKDFTNVDQYWMFDVATSPFFTEGSSFELGCQGNVFDTLISTLEI